MYKMKNTFLFVPQNYILPKQTALRADYLHRYDKFRKSDKSKTAVTDGEADSNAVENAVEKPDGEVTATA